MNRFKRVAIVHDDFIQNGGAEKLVECLLEIFPDADLFTSIISDAWRKKLLAQNPDLKIYASFLNKNPLKKESYKAAALLYPVAFWLFDFRKYDLVVSSTARFAHGIRTNKDSLHVSYVNSPARMVWEPASYFNKFFLPVVYPFLLILRLWDKFASTMPDILIANSGTIRERIKKYWKRDSTVVYPFHNLSADIPQRSFVKEHFILVSRLEKWKKIDLAVKACSELKEKLIIVGDGKYKRRLENMADSEYIKFAGRLREEDLIKTYMRSKALIMTQKEDFGITSIEAQSLGIPVIAYKSGGALETVVENKTGVFFEKQQTGSLKQAIENFNRVEIDAHLCILQADKFTKDKFIRRMLDIMAAAKQNGNINL